MTDPAIVAALSAGERPDAALLRLAEAPADAADAVLAAIEAAANGTALSEAEENLLFWGLHGLAAGRETRAFGPLMRLLRRPDDELDLLLGTSMTVTLPRIVVSTFDGDVAALRDAIVDTSINGFIRGSLLHALAFLAWEGRADLSAVVRLLERIDDERLAEPGDYFWNEWQYVIALLGLRALTPRVTAAFVDGRISTVIDDFLGFKEALEASEAAPGDGARFEADQIGYMDDVIGVLMQLDDVPDDDLDDGEDEFYEGDNYQDLEAPEGLVHDPSYDGPMKNPVRNVGRNDPCPCGSGKKFKKCCMNVA